MTRYRLTVVPEGLKEFSAANDAEAIARAERPLAGLDGEVCIPRKLEEIRGMLVYRAVRTVKEWS